MPLRILALDGTGISDLAPLRGLPLRQLGLAGVPIADLSPLEGMELDSISFSPQAVKRGLEVLRRMKSLRQIIAGSQLFTPDEFWRKYDAGEFK
jgi:hypothetical protein